MCAHIHAFEKEAGEKSQAARPQVMAASGGRCHPHSVFLWFMLEILLSLLACLFLSVFTLCGCCVHLLPCLMHRPTNSSHVNTVV